MLFRPDFIPITAIGTDGFVSVVDNDTFFSVTNDSNGQTIKMMGLPTAATAKGQIYQSNGTIKINS